ncbi:hypothetical protein BDQ12DRAFT_677659, partial [Crucibulum laeve]
PPSTGASRPQCERCPPSPPLPLTQVHPPPLPPFNGCQHERYPPPHHPLNTGASLQLQVLRLMAAMLHRL